MKLNSYCHFFTGHEASMTKPKSHGEDSSISIKTSTSNPTTKKTAKKFSRKSLFLSVFVKEC